MDNAELKEELAKVREKGFDDSFARFCADTFSSYSYPRESLAAAGMHAFFLRLFIEETVSGEIAGEEIPESLRGTFREVGGQAVRDTLSSADPSGMECCRAFVGNWCKSLSRGLP